MLVELLAVGLQLTSGRPPRQQVLVGILDGLVGLAVVVVKDVGPERREARYKPQVVVPPDEASVERDRDCRHVQAAEGGHVPGDDRCGLLETLHEVEPVREAVNCVEVAHFLLRNVTEELSGGVGVDVAEPVLELDGVTVAREQVLHQAAEALASRLLVDLEVVEVAARRGVPLVEVGITVLHGALRSHTHL